MALTEKEIQMCSGLLFKLEPGFLPKPIFEEIARLMCLPFVQLIPTKKENGIYQVGLFKRDPDDRFWPGMWHNPGGALRSNDTFETALTRLLKEEIKGTATRQAEFQSFLLNKNDRGPTLVFIYALFDPALDADSPIEWFPLERLPENTIASEKEVLAELKTHLP